MNKWRQVIPTDSFLNIYLLKHYPGSFMRVNFYWWQYVYDINVTSIGCQGIRTVVKEFLFLGGFFIRGGGNNKIRQKGGTSH